MNKSMIKNMFKSKGVNYFIVTLILLSIVTLAFEAALPQYHRFFFYLEVGYTTIFILEYLLRWSISENKLKYPFEILSLIDLIAILPTLLMFSASFTALRIFRLFRILRLLKIARYVNFYIWFTTQDNKKHITPILIKISLVFGLWIFGAFLLMLTEDSEGFRSLTDSLWNTVIVTMSGLDGDEPESFVGKVEIAILMFLGVLIIGFITGEIISGLIEKAQQKGKIDLLPLKTKLSNHILVINQNKMLYNILEQINGAYEGRHYIAVVSEGIRDFEIKDKKLSKKVLGVNNNILDKGVLERLNVEQAIGVIILSPENNKTYSIMSAISMINKIRHLKESNNSLQEDFKFVIEVNDEERFKDYQNILTKLEEVRKNIFLFNSKDFSEKLIVQSIVNPNTIPVYSELMTYTDHSNEFYREVMSEKMGEYTLSQLQEKLLSENIIFVGVEDQKGCFLIPDFNRKLKAYVAVFFIAYTYKKGSITKGLINQN